MTGAAITDSKNTPKTVTFPTAEYLRLVESDLRLEALRAAGVDNWEGYDHYDRDDVQAGLDKARSELTEEPEGHSDWDTAVDWLLNSRHTADPDIQAEFWAISDGIATVDEVETLSRAELQERRSAAARKDPTLPDG